MDVDSTPTTDEQIGLVWRIGNGLSGMAKNLDIVLRSDFLRDACLALSKRKSMLTVGRSSRFPATGELGRSSAGSLGMNFVCINDATGTIVLDQTCSDG